MDNCLSSSRMLLQGTIFVQQPAIGDRQLHDDRPGTADRNLASRHPHFASNVSQCHSFLAAWSSQRSSAGNLSNFLFASDNCRSAGDLGEAFCQKSRELTVNRSARANAFDDFLSDVASFIEVQGACLLGLLRQGAFADV